MSRWHYKLGRDEHGPVSLAELVELARKGAVTEATLVRDDSGGEPCAACNVIASGERSHGGYDNASVVEALGLKSA